MAILDNRKLGLCREGGWGLSVVGFYSILIIDDLPLRVVLLFRVSSSSGVTVVENKI